MKNHTFKLISALLVCVLLLADFAVAGGNDIVLCPAADNLSPRISMESVPLRQAFAALRSDAPESAGAEQPAEDILPPRFGYGKVLILTALFCGISVSFSLNLFYPFAALLDALARVSGYDLIFLKEIFLLPLVAGLSGLFWQFEKFVYGRFRASGGEEFSPQRRYLLKLGITAGAGLIFLRKITDETRAEMERVLRQIEQENNIGGKTAAAIGRILESGESIDEKYLERMSHPGFWRNFPELDSHEEAAARQFILHHNIVRAEIERLDKELLFEISVREFLLVVAASMIGADWKNLLRDLMRAPDFEKRGGKIIRAQFNDGGRAGLEQILRDGVPAAAAVKIGSDGMVPPAAPVYQVIDRKQSNRDKQKSRGKKESPIPEEKFLKVDISPEGRAMSFLSQAI